MAYELGLSGNFFDELKVGAGQVSNAAGVIGNAINPKAPAAGTPAPPESGLFGLPMPVVIGGGVVALVLVIAALRK